MGHPLFRCAEVDLAPLPVAAMLVNGDWTTSVSGDDRGLHYGDGVFETLAVRRGEPREWGRHLERLQCGCERLGIPSPPRQTLHDEARTVCRDTEQGVLKIMVTRGRGTRGYRPPAKSHPTRIVSIHPWPQYPSWYQTEGVLSTVCRTHLSRNVALAGIKHLNRLEHVLARSEWDDDYQEGLMLDAEGHVIEGTMSNLFFLRDGVLVSPDLSHAGVEGVTRARIIEWAKRSRQAIELCPVTLNELHRAQGMFFCNSIIGVWPVRRLERTEFPIPPLIEALRRDLWAD